MGGRQKAVAAFARMLYKASHMNDWKRLIAELRDAKKGGMTKAAISKAVGAHVNTITLLERGTTESPGFDLGTKLIALHAQRVRRAA